MPPSSALLDDLTLLGVLRTGRPPRSTGRRSLATTSYWYYRTCRAALAGTGGRLSSWIADLPQDLRTEAIELHLRLPDRILLPEPRELVPEMARVATDHPRLNLLNIEATAAAVLLDAVVLLSPEAASGVLPGVLEDEGIPWRPT